MIKIISNCTQLSNSQKTALESLKSTAYLHRYHGYKIAALTDDRIEVEFVFLIKNNPKYSETVNYKIRRVSRELGEVSYSNEFY